ncbi:hypothetical protein ACFL1M_02900 [Patescibacteria group bacterium]
MSEKSEREPKKKKPLKRNLPPDVETALETLGAIANADADDEIPKKKGQHTVTQGVQEKIFNMIEELPDMNEENNDKTED